MKKLKLYLLFPLLFFQVNSIGQIFQKGTQMVGTTTGVLKDFSGGASLVFYEDVKFSFTLTPDYGYMINEHMMIGGQTSLSFENADGFTFWTIGLMPFLRVYYPTEKRTRFFAEQFAGVAGIKATLVPFDIGTLAGGGIGIDYFIAPNVAVESTIRITFAQLNANRNLDYGIRFGLQIFFWKEDTNKK